MPPRKSQTSATNGFAQGKSRLPGIKHTPTASRSNFDSDSDDSDSLVSRTHEAAPLRLSQTILGLGRHNTLKQMLSGPTESSQEDHPPRIVTPKKRGRKPKTKQSDQASPVISASTPISKLNAAASQLGAPEDWENKPIRFDDIETAPPTKRKRGRPRKTPLPSASNGSTSREPKSGRPTKTKQVSKRQRTPELDHDYEEQVSHHLLDLTDDADRTSTRRASYNHRGKRVLSIGNGFEANPHSGISETEYYKVLDGTIPEPSQMRQLLGWCLRKQLTRDEHVESRDIEASEEDATARRIAKVIKNELLDDLVDGSISTSWYSRKVGEADTVSGKRIVRPNPQNESNKENVEIFTRKLRQLQNESHLWRRAFADSVEPLKNVAVHLGEATEEELRADLAAQGKSQDMAGVVSELGTLVHGMEANVGRAKKCAERDLPVSVDRIHHALYRLGQGMALAARLENERLSAQVARIVQSFMGRCDNEKSITSKELLRGISRMDAKRRQT